MPESLREQNKPVPYTPEELVAALRVLKPKHLMNMEHVHLAQLGDEGIAQIIRNGYHDGADMNYDAGKGGGAGQFVGRGEFGPKTLDAIIEHPQAAVVRSFLHNNRESHLTDEHVKKLIATTEPTLNGVPVTPQDIEASENPGDDTARHNMLDTWWKENRGKDLVNSSLSGFHNATSEQLEMAMDRMHRNHPQERPGTQNFDDSLQRILVHPNISNKQVMKIADQNPYLVSHSIREPHVPNDHPVKDANVVNHVYQKVIDDQASRPSDQGDYTMLGRIHDADNAFGKVTPENLARTWGIVKKQVDEGKPSPLGAVELARHPNAPPEVLRDIWEHTKRQPDEATKRGLMPSKELAHTHDPKTRLGQHLTENPKLPPDVLSDIIANTDTFNPAGAAAATPEHHKQMLDKAIAGGYYESPRYRHSNEEVIEGVKTHAKDPGTLKYLFDNEKAAGLFQSSPDNKVSRDFYQNYIDNPNTPPEVLRELHGFVPATRILDHANFPQDRIQEIAEGTDETDPNVHHAKNLVSDLDPDKYLYKPAKYESEYEKKFTTLRGYPNYDHGKDFGSVESKPGLSKLRVFRDKILEADPAKGELSPKSLGQGPFGGNWKPVQEKNGNISAKKLQELIDSHPSTKYNFGTESWDGGQRHTDRPQRVFKLNVTTDHIKQMKDAGVYSTFKKLSDYSNQSGHPVDNGHTIGWIRYEHHMKKPELPGKHLGKPEQDPWFDEDPAQHHERNEQKQAHDTIRSKPEAIHVDEVQTDMGPNTMAKLKEKPERAHEMGVNTAHLDKINDIVFGKHHPSEVLMEAFKQNQRDQGNHDVPIHMLDAKTKAPLSGMHPKELPAHMQFTYNQMPKKMGMKPAKYGETEQQTASELQNQPTWTDKIRKMEDELIIKALDDIKPGKPTHEFSREKQAKLPLQVGGGRVHYHDYNHLLTPQHKRAGYQLFVEHIPDHKIQAQLFHKGQGIGGASAIINPYSGDKMRIDSVAIGDNPEKPKHRGKGLGLAMYEAILAHAKHKAGIEKVHGTSHSTMAHGVHEKLSRKHGLAYKALPNYMEGSYQHWPDQESWESAKTGPFDDKYGAYEYMLKAETPFRSTGFKHKETGQIVETGGHHDITKLPGGEEENLDHWHQGFIDHAGTFHDREQAAKLVNMDKEKNRRNWLDSYDKEAFGKNEDGVISMLEQDDPMERILALKSAMVMPHHILIAINDEDPQVRAFAATHHIINGPLLTECLRQCKSADTFRMLLGHDACEDEHINYALETDWGGNGGPVDDEELP